MHRVDDHTKHRVDDHTKRTGDSGLDRRDTLTRRGKETMKRRCEWARSALDIAYHDREWGVPLHDERGLFELLVLEGAQAGLSWSTILRMRPAYRRAFKGFDVRRIASWTGREAQRLMRDAGIVRHRGKIESVIANAQAFLGVQREHGSFAAYLWRFVDGVPVQNRWRSLREVPATTSVSAALSRDLRARGFRFVGPTICYAFMQAAGLVNDHTVGCFRRLEVRLRTLRSRAARGPAARTGGGARSRRAGVAARGRVASSRRAR
jgi:DNA-3-methyladenine glycosylase I